MIIGKPDRLFSAIPGSMTYCKPKELFSMQPLSGSEVLKTQPGVHVVEEEGAGLRANIGIRGLDPDRSRTLLVLEDGIPVALAPYGEPELYYTPAIERMNGIELIKGSGQIQFGPQTIGGVLNYVTAAPPETWKGKVKMQSGIGGLRSILAQFGNTIGQSGYTISVLRKATDSLGNLRMNVSDIQAKWQIRSDKTTLVCKLGYYDESSNATYIGLTQNMYASGQSDFALLAPHDRLTIRRYSASAHHTYAIKNKWRINSKIYAFTTNRNWRRQDFVTNQNNQSKPLNWSGVTWGNEQQKGGAIYMLQSNAFRNRAFEVVAAESDAEVHFQKFGKKHTLKAGVRLLAEKAWEQRLNGSSPFSESGSLVEDEVRPATAFSAFTQWQSQLHATVQWHAGLRMEHVHYARNIFRRSFPIQGKAAIRDTNILGENTLFSTIPGAGLTWTPSDKYHVFTGIHAGYAPPRIKDAITNNGEVYSLNAEKSTNFEIGFRAMPMEGIRWEFTYFNMDFSNQIIPVSLSSGGSGVGLINGGETIHRGWESSLTFSVSEFAGWKANRLSIQSNITHSKARFSSDYLSNGLPVKNNTTPYAPALLVHTSVVFENESGLLLRISNQYVSRQFTDEINTDLPTPDGRNGVIPAYHTLDFHLGWNIKKWNTSIGCTIKNVTNERYIISRRPQGIRVGLPILTIGYIEYHF
jgi:Fe(3+) dicitrate transport protein